MIPSIETIVEDLLDGLVTKQQAINWLHEHAEDAGMDLRDHFAAQALTGSALLSSCSLEWAVQRAYLVADAMILERIK